MSPLPPGSHVAITHLARDVAGDALTETFSRLNAEMAESVVLRTREQVAALFRDLESIEPGVVQSPQWHPAPDAPAPGAVADVVRGRPQDRRRVLAVGSGVNPVWPA